MSKSRIVAVLLVSVMVFGVVEPLPVWAGRNESEGYGMSPRMAAGVVIGGIAGFFAGGFLGSVVGSGFMAVIYQSGGCPSCQDIGSPTVY